jgi:hypothetical protein
MAFGEMWPLGARSLAITSELWQHEAGILASPPEDVHPKEARQGGVKHSRAAQVRRASERRGGESRLLLCLVSASGLDG